jgi:probable rRNA maturation factor
MFALQNELLADWYDDVEKRGVVYQAKPTGPGAFPTAAERLELDRDMVADEQASGAVSPDTDAEGTR